MKTFFKRIMDFFFSLRTSLWLLACMLVFMLAGAVIMPAYKEYQQLHEMALFEFLTTQPLDVIWWLWGLIGILVILTVNTLFCSVESLVKKRKVTQWLLLISPQVIHIGFLFMLLAHLLSATGGSQKFVVAQKGSVFSISKDTILRVKDIEIRSDQSGYISNWKVWVEYYRGSRVIGTDTIAPNAPSLPKGFNINVKNLQAFPYHAVLLQISREPGAFWALVGGILFTAGIVALIILKMKLER